MVRKSINKNRFVGNVVKTARLKAGRCGEILVVSSVCCPDRSSSLPLLPPLSLFLFLSLSLPSFPSSLLNTIFFVPPCETEHNNKEIERGREMVGDFMVCVDRIIAPACLEAGHGGGGGYGAPAVDVGVGEERSSEKKKASSKKKKGEGEVTECRICQEEGEESEMEAPCACNGTLKVAFSVLPSFLLSIALLLLSWKAPFFPILFSVRNSFPTPLRERGKKKKG